MLTLRSDAKCEISTNNAAGLTLPFNIALFVGVYTVNHRNHQPGLKS